MQVKDLESQLRGAKKGKLFSHYTIYVIVDHLALSCHLNFVKDVVGSKQFAVIVPTAGNINIFELSSIFGSA